MIHRTFGIEIDIKNIKHSFVDRFPTSNLTPVLLRFPDRLPAEDLLGAVRTWLAILDSEAEE